MPMSPPATRTYCPWINSIKKILVSQTESYSDTKLVCKTGVGSKIPENPGKP